MKHSDRIFQVRIREHYFSKVYIAMICLNLFMISALGALLFSVELRLVFVYYFAAIKANHEEGLFPLST